MDYEEVITKFKEDKKRKNYFIQIKNNYFNISEIVVFKECVITKQLLIKRFQKIEAKEGGIYTLWDAITTPTKRKIPDRESKQRLGQLLHETKEEEKTRLYNMTMKLMTAGSMCNKHQ